MWTDCLIFSNQTWKTKGMLDISLNILFYFIFFSSNKSYSKLKMTDLNRSLDILE